MDFQKPLKLAPFLSFPLIFVLSISFNDTPLVHALNIGVEAFDSSVTLVSFSLISLLDFFQFL